jgi:flagella basal body P-ring formation protein FlgA
LRGRRVAWKRGTQTVSQRVLPGQKATMYRAGVPAMLLLSKPGMRISLPVTTLDAASPGQSVRVRVVGSNQIVRAQVDERRAVEGKDK